MTQKYLAVGQSKDGALWVYGFNNRFDAEAFVDVMQHTQFPKHDAFDITWGAMPLGISESVEVAVKDITDWVNQINMRSH